MILNLSQALVIAQKELKETLRDRRTLLVMIGIPVLLYPLLSIGVTQIVNMQMASLREQKIRLAVVGDARGLLDRLAADARIELVATDAEGRPFDPDSAALALRAKRVDAALVARPGDPSTALELELRYTIAEDRSNTARGRLVDMLERVYLAGAEVRLRERDQSLSLERIAPLKLVLVNVDPDLKGGFVFGRMIALLLVTLAVTFPFHPALDMTAGEKERGTLETLLVSPAGRREIVVGKYLAILVIGLAASVVNLVSMGLTFDQFAGMTKNMADATADHERRFEDADARLGPAFTFAEPERKQGLDLGLSFVSLLKILAALVPLVALFSAAALALSALARSYKEGQNYLTPLLVVVMPLSMVAMVPNIDLTMANAWVPVANVVLLVRDLFLGKLAFAPFLLAVASTSVLALAALAVAVAMFEREEVLFREAGARSMSLRPRPCEVPPVPVAVVAVAVSVILAAFAGPRLQVALVTRWGPDRVVDVVVVVTLASMASIAGLAALAVAWSRASWRTSLGLARPVGGAAMLAGAALFGAGGGIAIGPAAEWLAGAMGQGDASAEMQRMFGKLFALPLAALVALFALAPAIAEELLFRGVVLRSLLAKFRPGFAIAASAALFAANHVMIFRLPPTFVAGLFLGWLAWRSRSVLPGVAFHLAWNATPLMLAYFLEGTGRTELPSWCVPVGGAVAVAGFLAARAGAAAADRRDSGTPPTAEAVHAR